MDNETGAVSMPKWPAWVMLAVMAGCAYPAVRASNTSATEAVAEASAPAPLR